MPLLGELFREMLRGPAGEELEPVLGGGPGFGAVDGEVEDPVVVCGEVQGVVDEVERPDLGVVELLLAGVVDPDVVCGPPGAELLAERGQLADQRA
jgi:hypothetical protein